MLFEYYRGKSECNDSVWYTEGLYQKFIFQKFLVDIKDQGFTSFERIYSIDFTVYGNQISRYICTKLFTHFDEDNICTTSASCDTEHL